MGCYLSYSNETTITSDPDVEFYTEATYIVNAPKKSRVAEPKGSSSVFLYIKNNRLYHTPQYSSYLQCCMSSDYSKSYRLSNLDCVEVISGKVKLQGSFGNYNVELGLKIEVSDGFNPTMIKVFRTPDAVRLATLLQPHVNGQVITEPNTEGRVYVFKCQTVHTANYSGFSSGCTGPSVGYCS